MSIRAVLFFIIVNLFSASVVADDQFEIVGGWKFQSGDHVDWSRPDFNDREWKNVNVPKLLFQKSGQSVIGWYRVKFDVLALGSAQLALFIETIRHADEAWINGVKVGGLGKVHEAWDFMHTNPQSLPRLYPIPNYVLKETKNVLAIRFNTGFGEAQGAMFPGGAGITKGKVYIGDYEELLSQVHSIELNTMMIDTVFAVLSVLDLLIIVFLIKTALGPIPEFRWLLITSFFLLLGTVAQDMHYIYSHKYINANFLMMTAILVLPYTTAMYFWSQYQDIPSRIIMLVSVLWLLCVFILLYPEVPSEAKNIGWYAWKLVALICFFYSLFAALKGVKCRRFGAIAQLLGLVVCVLFIRSQWLPDNLFGHRNIQIGSLFYRYALLVAYFQQMAHLRVDFKKLNAKLVGVVESVQHSIARELHDGIGQHLASARLQTKLAEQTTGNKFSLIEQELDSSILGIRRLINGLHPVLLEKMNITEAICLESRNLETLHRVKIIINAQGCSLEKHIEMNLFRIFQEATNNAIKHGQASEIVISLKVKNNAVILIVSDNGKGFIVGQTTGFKEDGGQGLISMHERVALLNGNLDIISRAKKGTSIMVLLPLVANK